MKFMLILLLCACLTTGEAVRVSVYYEALCPASIAFIKDQFYPTWLELGGKYLDPDFVPYGAASHHKNSEGRWEFKCQHGPEECKGNMEQACALHVLSFNTTAKVEFINCVMSSGSPSKAGQRCANTLGIGYEPIETCLNSHKGSQLLAGFGNRTHNLKPGIKFVPTIVFNGIYSKHDREAYKHFRKVICRYIEGTKPPACSNLKETYKKKY